MDTHDKQNYKAGFIAVAGRPNVGKSTLINALMGQKIAAVSPRPQTTRRNQLGILTLEEAQVIFMDTPGVHRPRHLLGEWMNQEAEGSLEESDLVLWIVEGNGDDFQAVIQDHLVDFIGEYLRARPTRSQNHPDKNECHKCKTLCHTLPPLYRIRIPMEFLLL